MKENNLVYVKKDMYSLVRDIYEYSPELGGEVAMTLLEYLFNEEMSTDNDMIRYVVREMGRGLSKYSTTYKEV